MWLNRGPGLSEEYVSIEDILSIVVIEIILKIKFDLLFG